LYQRAQLKELLRGWLIGTENDTAQSSLKKAARLKPTMLEQVIGQM